ncbi:flagellar cap protein FliD N-terminal domain-containing protein, partial [Rubrivirga sp.]|uniref:flagellar cap protein FliD N-terminal domain-containing protein n=1 Tax=Rubrivirga sp. TaxID=1885344 RepID=UPI003C7424C9
MSANLSQIFNSGSLYEQLISQVIAVESQPRLKLRSEQTEQNVFKAVLGDYSSRVSSLNTVLERLSDPLQSPFGALSATSGSGFKASASDDAASASHEIQVAQLARADTRLSRQYASDATTLGALFVDSGQPDGGAPDTIGERSFTIQIAQSDGSSVDLEVAYAPPDGATDD